MDDLPAEQVPGALTALRARASRGSVGTWPPAWFGMGEGAQDDVSEHVDEILRDGLGRRPA